MTDELLKISARSIIDVWGGYDITDSRNGEPLGSARRKALKSILRDNWTLFDPAGNEIGSLVEDSAGMALVRRFIPLGALVPQKFHIDVAGASQPVTLRQKFNPFIRRLVVDIPPAIRSTGVSSPPLRGGRVRDTTSLPAVATLSVAASRP
jgi:hypothetical protein